MIMRPFRRCSRLALIVALLAACTSAARAQDPASAAHAEALMQQGQHAQAAKEYERVVKEHPENGVAWVRLGRAHMEAGDLDRAIEVETHALSMASVKARACFNLACVWTSKGDAKKGLQFVRDAVAAGLQSEDVLLAEPRLAPLQGEAEFKKMIADFRAARDKPEYHALDFWVGEWDVYDAQAQKVGTNLIELQEQGCLVAERWRDSTGGGGRSINYFDPATGAWAQDWVNHTGNVLHIKGRVVGKAMWFEGAATSRTGARSQSRTVLTPLPGGRVRQTIHHTPDEGKTWNLTFDVVYVPKGQSFRADEFPKDQAPGGGPAPRS